MDDHKTRSVLVLAVLGVILAGMACHPTCAQTLQTKQPENSPAPGLGPFSYPYRVGNLSFPRDEGKHSPTEWPITLIEWYAHYAHLTAEDGSRYFLFTAFITYDPIEWVLGGRFPHVIATLVDVTRGKTYYYRDMRRLKSFTAGHVDAQTASGDYFKWKGEDRPFQYDFRVAWRDPQVDFSLETDLRMVKPPLAVNGSGYIKLPKGDSGYYSQTRLDATGRLTIDGVAKKVSGVQWMDRQWLGATFAGGTGYSYDWWAIQLDNREEAILFRIWERDTNAVAMSVLEVVHADGSRQGVDRFSLTDLPFGWRLCAPSIAWDFEIVPACQGQGIWQSCDIVGTVAGKPVGGVAAAELARNIVHELDFMQELFVSAESSRKGVQERWLERARAVMSKTRLVD
jgi:predicted secreted hydrolase